MPKIRNIIIFISIAIVLILVYVFFIKKPTAPDTNLISTPSVSLPTESNLEGIVSNMELVDAEDFLSLLLSVKNIKLEDSIFNEAAWLNLKDSSIILIPDGTEGRPNPFAPLGSDSIPSSSTNTTSVESTPATSAPVVPTPTPTPTPTTPSSPKTPNNPL